MAVTKRPRPAMAGESTRAKHYRYGVKWRLGGGKDGAWQSVAVGPTDGHHAEAVKLNAWLKSEAWAVAADDPRVAERLGLATPEPEPADDDEPALTVHELVRRWIEERPGRTERTRLSYTATLHALGDLGDMPADRVTRRHVNAWFAGRERAGRKPKTLQISRVVLRGSLRGYADVDALFADTRGYAKAQRHVTPVHMSREQIADLLAHADDEGLRLPILAAAELGLRVGEVMGLRARDVDLAARVVRVEFQIKQATKRGEGFKPEPLKTARSRREVPMSDALVSALALVAELPADAPVFAPSYADWWLADGLDKAWRRVVAATPSVPNNTRFHDVRHSAAIRWLTSGVDLGTVSKWLGHADVRVTDEAYGRIVGAREHALMATAGLGLG